MEWSENLLTGNNFIDKQHMDIAEMVSAFHEAIRHGGGIKRTQFSYLLASIEQHCADEEKLLKKFSNYKYYRHKKSHVILLNNIRSMCAYIESKPLNPYTGDFIISETMFWLRDHVRRQDKDFLQIAPTETYAVALRK